MAAKFANGAAIRASEGGPVMWVVSSTAVGSTYSYQLGHVMGGKHQQQGTTMLENKLVAAT